MRFQSWLWISLKTPNLAIILFTNPRTSSRVKFQQLHSRICRKVRCARSGRTCRPCVQFLKLHLLFCVKRHAHYRQCNLVIRTWSSIWTACQGSRTLKCLVFWRRLSSQLSHAQSRRMSLKSTSSSQSLELCNSFHCWLKMPQDQIQHFNNQITNSLTQEEKLALITELSI